MSTAVALAEGKPAGAATRDPFTWPFAADSIWNRPVGSGASYVRVGFTPARYTGSDTELIYRIPAGSPSRPMYDPGDWSRQRCRGTAVADPTRRRTLPLPDGLVIPDVSPPDNPNNASAFLLPDGDTLVQLNGTARCTATGPLYGWADRDRSIRGDGTLGGHAGSGLSSIGGSLRTGELIGPARIRHALKVNVWGQKYLHYSPNSATKGYQWPAVRADNYAAGSTCVRDGVPGYRCYGGTVPKLEMGSLLAIPPSVDLASLGLKTYPAQKLFAALRDYGAYVVDDTAGDAYAFGVQKEALTQFESSYHYPFDSQSGDFHDDINRLMSALSVIENNQPGGSAAGGGTPRMPPPPAFG